MQPLLRLAGNQRFWFIAGLIIAAAFSRLLPHPYNFSPVGAIALFAGARFGSLKLALFVPLAALLASDMFLGFYEGMSLIYASFALLVLLGRFALRNTRSPLKIGACAIAASLLFFAASNCVWLYNENLYALSPDGQIAAYVAALPFLWNSLLGDLFYSGLLFGSLAFAERRGAFTAQPARA